MSEAKQVSEGLEKEAVEKSVAPDKPAEGGGIRRVRVALAGNPNCGKTTLFNALTGAHQHVGNYPGVTVERRDGRFMVREGVEASLTDLPGTYSLTSLSPEERVAQDELLAGGHDVVVVVADSTNLQRNLVLLAQVMQMGANVVLALNMSDEARAAGQVLDLPQMERLLGCPVVETVGHRRQGVEGLKAAIGRALDAPGRHHRLVMGQRLDDAIAAVRKSVPGDFCRPETLDWIASRLLIGEPDVVSRMKARADGEAVMKAVSVVREKLEGETGQDAALLVTEGHFGFVDGLLKEVVTQPSRADARAMTERIDAIVAHRALGLPIFALVMYAIFWLTFTLGDPPMDWIKSGFDLLAEAINGAWGEAGKESLLRSLLVDGVIGGVGGVVVFLPNILLLFLGLALLEDTGYLARAAFLVDQVMHRFGLHGKSFIPMMTGFGCSVPGIMATRTLENEKDRLTTMFVLPLISCGARLPIWLLLVPAFFPKGWRAPMMFAIYFTGIALALCLALLVRRTVLKGEESPFVMELPPYRVPTLRGALTKMLERGWMYLKKAGTVILAVSIVLWALSTFPKMEASEVMSLVGSGKVTVAEAPPSSLNCADGDAAGQEGKDATRTSVASRLDQARGGGDVVLSPSELKAALGEERLSNSYAGRISRFVEPAFRPLGFDWKLVTAMLGAFAAKEVFVAQLGIIYSMGEVGEDSAGLQAAISADYSPLTGLSLMLFLLISAPCMATFAVTRRESNSWKWAFGQFFGLTAIGYALAFLVYQVGALLGF